MLKNETVKVISIIAFVLCGIFLFIDEAISMIIFGGIFFGLSLLSITFLIHITKNGLRSEGTLKKIQYDSDGDPYPIVEFTTADGKSIQGEPFVHTSGHFGGIQLKKTSTHKPISILYSPKDPSKFVIGTKQDFDYFAFLIFGLIGLAFIVLGFCDVFGVIDWFNS